MGRNRSTVGRLVVLMLLAGVLSPRIRAELSSATDFAPLPSDPMPLEPASRDAAAQGAAETIVVDRVEVDVLALDGDGRFVPGLTAADFEVTVEGQPVDIIDFDVRGVSSSPPTPSPNGDAQPPSEPLNAEPRRFGIFVDLLNSSVSSIRRVQPALLEFATKALQPTDKALLAVLASDRRLLVLVKYSDSRERLAEAIQLLVGNAKMETQEEDREKAVTDLLSMTDSEMRYAAMRGFAVDMAADVAKGYAVEDFHSSLHALNALASLAETMDVGFSGPNLIVYVSDGLAIKPAQKVFDIINKYAERLPEGSFKRASFGHDLQAMVAGSVERLNRSRATIYALDARGPFQSGTSSVTHAPGAFGRILSVGEELRLFTDYQQTLNAVAVDTGGRLYSNQVEYGDSLSAIEEQTRRRYYLTFRPPVPPKKAKKPRFHEIQVHCLRDGVHVQARKGYFD